MIQNRHLRRPRFHNKSPFLGSFQESFEKQQIQIRVGSQRRISHYPQESLATVFPTQLLLPSTALQKITLSYQNIKTLRFGSVVSRATSSNHQRFCLSYHWLQLAVRCSKWAELEHPGRIVQCSDSRQA